MSARGKYQHRPVVYGPTPGPWSAGLTNTKIVVDDSRGGRLATLAIVPQSVHAAEGVATAVLMAASPEMCRALEPFATHAAALVAENEDTDIREVVAEVPITVGDIRRALAALTRARGPS